MTNVPIYTFYTLPKQTDCDTHDRIKIKSKSYNLLFSFYRKVNKKEQKKKWKKKIFSQNKYIHKLFMSRAPA